MNAPFPFPVRFVGLALCVACSSSSANRSASDAGSSNEGGPVDVAAPRLVGPLSATLLTSRRPTFIWELASGTDGARIEICADRTCKNVLDAFDARGKRGAPSADLHAGVVFWRAHGMAGSAVGATTSATWELSVPAGSAPVALTWGALLDGNGDGYGDIVVGDSDLYSATQHVYFYEGGPKGPSTTASSILSAPAPVSHYASSIASAGDVDGDGFPELLVGSPGETSVYVYAGKSTGYSEPPALVLHGAAQSQFGAAVDGAGDVNGDGYADVVVGSPGLGTSDAGAGAGGAIVYLGGPMGLSASHSVALPSPATGDEEEIGQFVAAAGDVNGDGVGDLAVYGGIGTADPQHLAVYMGSRTSFGQAQPLLLEYEGASTTWLGIANLLSSAGDVDGDGYPDLAMASSSPPNSFYETDHVTYFYGGPSGLAPIPTCRVDSDIAATDHFATSLTAADFDGNGTTDMGVAIVSNATRPPVAQVLEGSLPEPSFATTIVTTDPTRVFLREVGASDVDGDGYWDLIVGFPGRTTPVDGGTLLGAVEVHRGGPQGVATSASTTLLPPDTTALAFGGSLGQR